MGSNKTKSMFISDTHFGHENILKFRTRFSSIEEHDAFICDNILSVCNNKTTLYILGDVVIHKQSLHFLKLICDNVGYVRIIAGNHDCERSYSPSVMDLFDAGISSFRGLQSYKDCWLSHAPVHPNEFYRKNLNIHGHMHEKHIMLDENNRDPMYCNVSCEAVDYTPIKYEEILKRCGKL